MSYVNDIEDYSTAKALLAMQSEIQELRDRVGFLVQNNTLVVGQGALKIIVSPTVPSTPTESGWLWYKPGNPGNYYWSVEVTGGTWDWVGPLPTGDTGA